MNQPRPNRGRIPEYLKGGYTPEHVRMDIEPQVAGVNRLPIQPQQRKAAPPQQQRPSVHAPDQTVKLPPNPRVQVGNEQEWFQSAPQPQQQSRPRIEFVDNNEYVDSAQLQGGDGFSQQFNWENNPSAQQTPNEFQFPLAAGTYIVYCGDILIRISDDINIIRRTVESLVIEQNQNIDSITVLKSLEVDFGVLLR